MADKPWKNEERLRKLYHGEDLSSREVADRLGCGKKTVLRWLDNHGIPKESRGKSVDDERLYDESWLREKYVDEQLSSRDIAGLLGCGKKAVLRHLEKFGVERRDVSTATKLGMDTGHAGFHTSQNGYEISAVRDPDRSRQIEIHRLVAVAHGADVDRVFDGYQHHVHHKNGIPWDNRPENLEVVTASEHRMRHNNGETA